MRHPPVGKVVAGDHDAVKLLGCESVMAAAEKLKRRLARVFVRDAVFVYVFETVERKKALLAGVVVQLQAVVKAVVVICVIHADNQDDAVWLQAKTHHVVVFDKPSGRIHGVSVVYVTDFAVPYAVMSRVVFY